MNNYTINIENNIFDITTPNVSATNGIYGILIDSLADETTIPPSGDVDNNGTVNIQNNILKNFAFTGASAVDQYYRGIAIFRPRVTYKIEHNSINMPLSDMVTGVTVGRVGAIIVPTAASTAPINLKNNLIRMAQTAGTGVNLVYATGGVLTSGGNNLVSTGGANIGYVGTTTYADFAAWQAAGYDTAATKGQSVDPTTTTPPWDSNLKFGCYGIPSPMVGVASSSVLTDIDGEARPATGATPGADEPRVGTPPTPTPIVLSTNSSWGLYE
ncbi:MAG: hypothetical protein NT106_08545, partial [Candidatus Sumerlaeota bacterium]|nr:hypothetical protein [Candidatus Sumerlaeota bacterium]